jgi:Kef-type K+ transport system membrane component KefB
MTIEQLIVAVGTIFLVARLTGLFFRRIGQPQVVGEMVAGILLGPSFLGHFFPDVFSRIFPENSMPTLTNLSQLGLLLFMFVVGLEVDVDKVLKRGKVVLVTSRLSIVLPLAMGILLAGLFYPRFAGRGVAFPLFALFIGTALSITAFPVLAGILKERKLLNSDLGAMAISCAALDDVSAWLLLAILTAMAHSAQSWARLCLILLALLLFVLIMFFPVRWAMARLEKICRNKNWGLGPFCALVLIMLAASWTTEKLGVHALFGAFIAGFIMPKGTALIADTIEKLETLTVTMLLPIFFVLTGMRTRIDMLHGAGAWGYALVIIAVAVVGKLGGAAIAARVGGMGWKDAFGLGILMNTRGLVELVILNAGLELGILSSALFTMMVVMALVTTFMTSPLLIGLYGTSVHAFRRDVQPEKNLQPDLSFKAAAGE